MGQRGRAELPPLIQSVNKWLQLCITPQRAENVDTRCCRCFPCVTERMPGVVPPSLRSFALKNTCLPMSEDMPVSCLVPEAGLELEAGQRVSDEKQVTGASLARVRAPT